MVSDTAVNPETEDIEDNTPVTQMGPLDQFEKLKKWVQLDWEANSDWRRQAEEDYAFEAGDQWPAEDKERLRAMKRPYMTFNRISSTVNVICGMEISNRMEVRYIPRTIDDSGVNDDYTEVARWIRDQCDAESEESNAFRDSNICGMGWTETRIDYERDPEGEIPIERIDPLEMGWDSSAVKPGLSDACRLFRVKEMSLETAQQLFPDADMSVLNASWLTKIDDSGEVSDRELARQYESGEQDARPRLVRIVQVQWYELEDAYTVLDPMTGASQEYDAETFKTLQEAATTKGIALQSAKRRKRCYYQAFLGSEMLGEVHKAPCKEDFSWKAITAYRDRNKRQFYGVVRQMRDPQMWANAFLSSTLHQIMTSGKGVMAERSAADNPQKFEDEWAQADKITWVKEGALSGPNPKIQPKTQSAIPPQLGGLMEMSLNAIRDVPGVNVEILGQADRQQAASLEYQRRQSASTILAPLFDGLRRYRKAQGRLLLYFIDTYIPEGRLIRITGEEGEQFVKFMKNPETVRYDVIVDEAASSPNQKEMTWAFIQNMLPVVAQSGMLTPPVIGEILKCSPLPASVANKFIQLATPDPSQPPKPNPDELKAQNEAQKNQQDFALGQADVQLRSQELQVKTAELALKHREIEHQQTMQAMQMHHDRSTQMADIQAQTEQQTVQAIGPQLVPMMQGMAQGLANLGAGMSDGITQLAAAIAQSQQQTNQLLAGMIAKMDQDSQNLQAVLSAPKMIDFDPATGKPVGIRTVARTEMN